MKMPVSRKRLLQCCIAAHCLLPIFISTSLEATVCSWEYLIWMPRSKQADPLYRFVRNGKAGYIDQSGKVVIEPKFEFYSNKRGEQAIPERFALASHFYKGLAHVKIKSTAEKNINDSEAKGSFAYIDVNGRKVFSY